MSFSKSAILFERVSMIACDEDYQLWDYYICTIKKSLPYKKVTTLNIDSYLITLTLTTPSISNEASSASASARMYA